MDILCFGGKKNSKILDSGAVSAYPETIDIDSLTTIKMRYISTHEAGPFSHVRASV